jgi:nucleoside-diphosphate-sugar epimerase
VLITGSTGFIGSRLALQCQERGHEVVALGQTNTAMEMFRDTELRKAGIRVVPIGITDRRGLAEHLTRCDTVFHLAAAQHEANVPDGHFWEVNVEGTRTLLETSRDAGVKRFVHGSTIGVYGAALDGEIDERTPTRPDNVYGITKLEGERVVRQFAEDLEIAIIRISETYGAGDGRLLKLFKAIRKGVFFVIGNGGNLHQLIHVDDLNRGLLAAATRPQGIGETIVLAGAERLTTTEMCETIARCLSTRLPRFRAPLWPFDVAAVVLETVCRPLRIQPPLHRRRLDFFKKTFYFDTKQAAALLDFNPSVSFADGVTATAQWYTANGFLE